MAYELKGTIKRIYDTQQFPSGLTKREFVVTTSENYPQEIKLEFVKEKVSLLDKYREGDSVEVGFDVRGNEFNDKYYVNLAAWKIRSLDTDAKPEASRNEPSAHAAAPLIPTLDEDDGGIPF